MKALEEIYKIYRLFHRSDLKISAKSSEFFKMDIEVSQFRVFHSFSPTNVAIFTLNFDAMLSEFRDTVRKCKYIEICRNCAKYCAQFLQLSKTNFRNYSFSGMNSAFASVARPQAAPSYANARLPAAKISTARRASVPAGKGSGSGRSGVRMYLWMLF